MDIKKYYNENKIFVWILSILILIGIILLIVFLTIPKNNTPTIQIPTDGDEDEEEDGEEDGEEGEEGEEDGEEEGEEGEEGEEDGEEGEEDGEEGEEDGEEGDDPEFIYYNGSNGGINFNFKVPNIGFPLKINFEDESEFYFNDNDSYFKDKGSDVVEYRVDLSKINLYSCEGEEFSLYEFYNSYDYLIEINSKIYKGSVGLPSDDDIINEILKNTYYCVYSKPFGCGGNPNYRDLEKDECLKMGAVEIGSYDDLPNGCWKNNIGSVNYNNNPNENVCIISSEFEGWECLCE